MLQTLTEAVNRLALIEERQAQFVAAQERAFKAIEKVEVLNEKFEERVLERIDRLGSRVSALEQERGMTKQVNHWVLLAMQTGIGLLILVILKGLKWL